MKKLTLSKLILFSAVLFQIAINTSCNEKEPTKPTNDEELITTLKLKFHNQSDSSVFSEFIFRDTDGEGGNAPIQWDTIRLNPGKYWVSASLLNESNPNDIENITEEIVAEADEHCFFYNHNLHRLTVDYADNYFGLPLGLATNWDAQSAESGTITVVLKHMPDGIKKVDPLVGDTDLEVKFNIEIK
jgi:hypothetical protein